MKQLVSGIAIALAIAAACAPQAYAFSMQTMENTNPDGSVKFADPDQRSPLNNPAPAADSRGGATKGINLGPNFGLSFSNGGRGGDEASRQRDPRLGFVPGDDNRDSGGRTFFGGMPDRIGPN